MADLFDLMLEGSGRLWGDDSIPEALPAFSISEYLADILLNPHDKQHIVITIYSKSGKGKSMVANSIADALSEVLARRLGTRPEQHFNIDHVIILDKKASNDMIVQLSRKRFPILIIDEGVDDANSRRSMTLENVVSQKVAAVIREFQMCIIRCVQVKSFIDKGVREQSTHELYITRAAHAAGYNECKFKVMVDRGESERWGVYPTSADGFSKVFRVRVGLPQRPGLREAYETKKIQKTREFIDTVLSATAPEPVKQDGVSEKRAEVNRWCAAAMAFHAAHPDWSKSKCVSMAGGCRETFDAYLRRNNIPSWTVSRRKCGAAVDEGI